MSVVALACGAPSAQTVTAATTVRAGEAGSPLPGAGGTARTLTTSPGTKPSAGAVPAGAATPARTNQAGTFGHVELTACIVSSVPTARGVRAVSAPTMNEHLVVVIAICTVRPCRHRVGRTPRLRIRA